MVENGRISRESQPTGAGVERGKSRCSRGKYPLKYHCAKFTPGATIPLYTSYHPLYLHRPPLTARTYFNTIYQTQNI